MQSCKGFIRTFSLKVREGITEAFKNPLQFFKRLLRSKLFKSVAVFLLLFLSLHIAFPLPAPKPYSRTVYAADGSLLKTFLSSDDKWRLRTSSSEISADFKKAIMEKEDKWFYWHPGINVFAVARAAVMNLLSGRVTSGASTITMQTARMLEPGERTLVKKIQEMFRALQLELCYSKDEIFEMYLSYLPFGGNIEGVKAASYLYFNRPPEKLSLAQATALALIPNDPNRLRPDRNGARLTARRNALLEEFRTNEVFDDGTIDDALNEPLDQIRYSFPDRAPHFSLRAAKLSNTDIVRTYLSPSIQDKAEGLLNRYMPGMVPLGIKNAAIIIIDNATMGVVGYCGSQSFHDTLHSGQVDGVFALRSPGSTLKPFLFGEAFAHGLLTPKSRVLDIPSDLGGYVPENYRKGFDGYVTASYALLNSLNIPAVRLLQETGVAPFISLLHRAGMDEIFKRKQKLGLSLILGGCDVTLAELTGAYTIFANAGYKKPMHFLIPEEEDARDSIQVLDQSATYLIATILSGLQRSDLPAGYSGDANLPRIGWKTGTSFGKRDAWAIGFSVRYTIGVWVGNFDNTGSPNLSGAESAVPLLIDLFNAIDRDSGKRWFQRPEKTGRRKVCSYTGMLPGKLCSSLTEDFYIKGISSGSVCDLEQEVSVDSSLKISYCKECLPDSGYIKKVYPLYPPELTLWYELQKSPYSHPPEHNPACTAKLNTGGPKILSPTESYTYYIESESNTEVLFQAASNPKVRKHYWYVDDEFYSSAPPSKKVFFRLKPGTTKVTCIDDAGGSTSVIMKVKEY